MAVGWSATNILIQVIQLLDCLLLWPKMPKIVAIVKIIIQSGFGRDEHPFSWCALFCPVFG